MGASEAGIVKYVDIIWDWNGTLFDDAWLCVETMNHILRRRKLPPLSADQYAERFRFPVEAYYRDLPFDWSAESFEEIGREFMREYEARRLECSLRAGAKDVLAAIRAKGVRQHLISGYHQQTLEELVIHFGLAGFFEDVVGAEDLYGRGKLHLADRWLKRQPRARHRLVVGDTVHDFELACRLGADCALIPAGHNSRRRLEACGARIVESLQDLLATF